MLTRTSTMLLEGLKNAANKTSWLEFDSRYRPVLLAVANRLGLPEQQADDAVQDTLAAFVNQYSQGQYDRQKGRLRDWLSGIMIHKVRDIQRKQYRQREVISSKPPAYFEEIEDESVRAAVEAEWAKAIMNQCLEEMREEVSPKAIEIFELYVLKQWLPKLVSQHCGVSVDVVYQTKLRMLKRIAQLKPRIEKIW